MRRVAALVALGACVPDVHPIGDTAWSIALQRGQTAMRGGPAGHVALVRDGQVEVIGPDGASAWMASISGSAVGIALDDTGGLIVLVRATPPSFASTLVCYAPDGALRWSVHRPEDLDVAKTKLVRDVDGATWLLTAPPSPAFPVWERYDAAGARVGTGELAFRLARDAQIGAARPGGGLVVADEGGGVTAIDPAGGYLWSVGKSASRLEGFVLHEDGELTLRTHNTLVRFDAVRAERWRSVVGPGFSITALEGGSIVTDAFDGLGDDFAVGTLIHVDGDGHVAREVAREAESFFQVVAGPVRADFTIRRSNGTVERRVDVR